MSILGKFEPTLSDEQLRAIGRITANWAFAESMFDLHLYILTNPEYGLGHGKFDGNFKISFKKRSRAIREAIKKAKISEAKATELRALLDTGTRLKRLRDDINHGLWGTSHPDHVSVSEMSFESLGSRKSQADLETMTDCADQISALNAKLIQYSVIETQQPLPRPQPRTTYAQGFQFGIHPSPATSGKLSGLLGPREDSDE